jgi:hypothetical protein
VGVTVAAIRMVAAAVLVSAAVQAAEVARTARLAMQVAQETDGTPTPRWLAAAGLFNDATTVAALAAEPAPFDAPEAAWRDLVVSRIEAWTAAMPGLERPFDDTEPPALLYVLVGNVGAMDAFVVDDTTIAFDVGALQRIYGDASTPENGARIDRFFAHEYTHVVHRAWRAQRDLDLDTPLERALWVCLTEGLGNYRSLSDRWFADDTQLSEHARIVLARLQPILVDRLGRLATASDEEAVELTRGLSMGPFEEKWGALPVALWLAVEVAADPDALAHWIERGPWGVLDLARRHLPSDLAATLPEWPGN